MSDLTNEPEELPGHLQMRMVHHTDLIVNEWNPSEMSASKRETLADTIRRDGAVVQPLLVIPHPEEEEKFLIVDGDKRYAQGMEAGIEWFPVVVMPMSIDEAKIKTLAMNNVRGESVPLKLAHLLVDLYREYSAEEITRLTGIGAEEQTTSLKELDPEITPDDGPRITVDEDATPVEVTILLMPEQNDDFEVAMHRSLGFMAGAAIPLVGDDVDDWTKLLRQAPTLTGNKLRSAALSAMAYGFTLLTDEQKALIKIEMERRKRPAITLEGSEEGDEIDL